MLPLGYCINHLKLIKMSKKIFIRVGFTDLVVEDTGKQILPKYVEIKNPETGKVLGEVQLTILNHELENGEEVDENGEQF